jgi:hypothetical protein
VVDGRYPATATQSYDRAAPAQAVSMMRNWPGLSFRSEPSEQPEWPAQRNPEPGWSARPERSEPRKGPDAAVVLQRALDQATWFLWRRGSGSTAQRRRPRSPHAHSSPSVQRWMGRGGSGTCEVDWSATTRSSRRGGTRLIRRHCPFLWLTIGAARDWRLPSTTKGSIVH